MAVDVSVRVASDGTEVLRSVSAGARRMDSPGRDICGLDNLGIRGVEMGGAAAKSGLKPTGIVSVRILGSSWGCWKASWSLCVG